MRIPAAGFLFACVLLCPSAIASPDTKAISDVSVTPAFFNPSLGQKATIAFSLSRTGKVTLSILDRDRFVVRTLPAVQAKAGRNVIFCDGKDDAGTVLPDEAYGIRLGFSSGEVRESFDPSSGFHSVHDDPKRSYSPVANALTYALGRPSRVHIQAGEAVFVEKLGRMDGPVLKTIVDRQPRAAGSVAEAWDGYDESGTIYLPDLKNFVVSIFAESLPDCALITVGNRRNTFAAYAADHRPLEAKQPRQHASGPASRHHSGLNAFEDRSPRLSVDLAGDRDSRGRVRLPAKPATLSVAMSAEDAHYFLSVETSITVYLDEKLIEEKKTNANPTTASLAPASWPAGEHRLAVNWISPFGPVGATALRVIVEPRPQTQGALR